jgi:hypothetical protein
VDAKNVLGGEEAAPLLRGFLIDLFCEDDFWFIRIKLGADVLFWQGQDAGQDNGDVVMVGGEGIRIAELGTQINGLHVANGGEMVPDGDDLTQMGAVRVELAHFLVMGEVLSAEILDGTTVGGEDDVALVLFGGEGGEARRFLDLDDGEAPGHEGKACQQYKQQHEHAAANRTITAELKLIWQGGAHGFWGMI